MSTVSSPAALPKHIETLLGQRSSHVAAIAAIDATLSRVSAALGSTAPTAAAPRAVAARKAPVKKAAAKVVAKAPVTKAPAKAPAKAPVTRAKGGLTANDFVIEFIKAKKNPTSQEINKHWVASGRKGMADNNLSLLTKAKTLKRTPLEGGQRGSRYTVA
jgi:hypothetical protein